MALPTFVFFPQVAEVLQQFGIGLDTVDFPSLQAAATQPRQVAASTVLLAEQQVDATVAPLGRPPGEPAQVSGEREGERKRKNKEEKAEYDWLSSCVGVAHFANVRDKYTGLGTVGSNCF